MRLQRTRASTLGAAVFAAAVPFWCLLLAPPALAQTADAGSLEPRVANPGEADAPADLVRELVLPEEPPVTGPLTQPDEGDLAPHAALEVPEAAPSAPPDQNAWSIAATLSGSARVSWQAATAFPLDSSLGPTSLSPLLTRIRINPELRVGPFGLVVEADAATGASWGVPEVAREQDPDSPVRGLLIHQMPYPRFAGLEPYGVRKLYLEYAWKTGAFRVGQQTSQWGLGLLAHDGSRDAEPGHFGQSFFGTLTYRALLLAHPFQTGPWRAVETAVAADLVVRDGQAEFVNGDRAFQAVLAVRYAPDPAHWVGVYGVYRNQRNQRVTDGAHATDAFVLDVAGRWEFLRREDRAFKVGFEFVGVGGSTTEGRTANAATLALSQFGFAATATYRVREFSVLLDTGYASGDRNSNDGRLESFRFDRDYKVGLVLFEQVLGYQSARGAARVADPALGGTPPEATSHLATGGAVSQAWYLFPKVNFAVAEWFDVYGGPLFAFSTAPLNDPYESLLAGGAARNSLGGAPGSFLGTELDLGAQARFHPAPEVLISVTAEAGVLLPGDAFRLPDSSLMAPVGFGRLRAALGI